MSFFYGNFLFRVSNCRDETAVWNKSCWASYLNKSTSSLMPVAFECSYWVVIARLMRFIGHVLVSALEYLSKVSFLPLDSEVIWISTSVFFILVDTSVLASFKTLKLASLQNTWRCRKYVKPVNNICCFCCNAFFYLDLFLSHFVFSATALNRIKLFPSVHRGF